MIRQKAGNKKGPALMLIFSIVSQKSRDWLADVVIKMMWSLKRLAMLKCESRTSLHVVQFVLVILRMASLDTLFLCSAGQQAGFVFSLFLSFMQKSRLLCL